MSRAQALALLLGVLLISAPLISADEDYDEDDDDDAAEKPASSEGDVVNITEDNFEDTVSKKPFALVRPLAGLQQPPGQTSRRM